MAFALVTQPDLVQCAHCPRMVQDVAEGVPEGWDGLFADGDWLFTCPECRVTLAEPVVAVHRPKRGDIALFVKAPGGVRTCSLALGEASALHKTLGQALALAANPGGLA